MGNNGIIAAHEVYKVERILTHDHEYLTPLVYWKSRHFKKCFGNISTSPFIPNVSKPIALRSLYVYAKIKIYYVTQPSTIAIQTSIITDQTCLIAYITLTACFDQKWNGRLSNGGIDLMLENKLISFKVFFISNTYALNCTQYSPAH